MKFDRLDIHKEFKWLVWEIRQDGTYLSVVKDFIPKNFRMEEIKKILIKNGIINFDIVKIENVIKAASGEFEFIGLPFELFEENKRKYLHLQVTPMQASFSIDISILQTEYNITLNDILFILSEKSVTYGIDYDIIGQILSQNFYGQEFIIATATMPVVGKNAVIKEVIPIDVNAKPFLNEDGTADYKKWENIRQIKQNDIICIRIPPTPGIPGTSVFGTPLSPIHGEDRALPAGANTKEIDNKTKLVASIDGFLYRQGHDICVGGIYIVKEDVNFKTGNIEYYGDVLVRGNVNAGFSVKADGNISVEGAVEENTYIESKKGNIFVKGSVFGKNSTKIIAAKNLAVENIQDAEVKVGKTFTANGLILNCQIETENLNMPNSGCIMGSIINFSGQLKCGSIGGKVGSVNEFIYSENEREVLKEELKKQNDFLQKLNDAIEILTDRLFAIKPSNITPEIQNKIDVLKSQLLSCNNSKELLVNKRKKLLRLIELMPDKDALISAYRLSPILKVSMFGKSQEFKQELSHLKISWKNGSIKIEAM